MINSCGRHRRCRVRGRHRRPRTRMLPALVRRMPRPARCTKAVRAAAPITRGTPVFGFGRPARVIAAEVRRREETRVTGVQMRGPWW